MLINNPAWIDRPTESEPEYLYIVKHERLGYLQKLTTEAIYEVPEGCKWAMPWFKVRAIWNRAFVNAVVFSDRGPAKDTIKMLHRIGIQDVAYLKWSMEYERLGNQKPG